MKRLLALLIGLSSAFALAGARVTVAPLGESEFADTETSTNVAFTASSATDDLLEVRLALHASETNALTVSFGTDAEADGRLAPDECGLSLGWECGEWFVREEATGWRQTLSGAAGLQTIVFRLRLGSDGTLRSLALRDDSGHPLALWSGSLPRGLFCREWNLLNVTSHGFPSPEAEVAVRLGGVGFTVRIR